MNIFIKYVALFYLLQTKALNVIYYNKKHVSIYFDEKFYCLDSIKNESIITLYINKNFGKTEASVTEIHTFLIYILNLKNKSNESLLNLLIEEKKDVSKDDRTQKGFKNQLTKEEIKEILDFLRAEGFIIKESIWLEYIVTIFIITVIILAILLYLHKKFNIIRVNKLISNRSFII